MKEISKIVGRLRLALSLVALLAVAALPFSAVNAVADQDSVSEPVDFSEPAGLPMPVLPVDPCVEPNPLPYPCPSDPNTPPVADSQWLTVTQDQQLAITLTATDADGAPVTIAVIYGPEHGKWEPAPEPDPAGYGIVYTPEPGYVGDDVIKFKASDGLAAGEGAVYITVKPLPESGKNHAPVAFDASYETGFNQPVPVILSATDGDGDELAYTIYGPGNGTLGPSALPTIGAYTYTPNLNFVGDDYVSFWVSDGDLGSNMAKVKITVHGPVVEEVSATPPPGTYVGTQSVALAAEGSEAIRYTTDGTDPTCAVEMPEASALPNGDLYDGPITVADSTTIRAIACFPAGFQSGVGEFAYVITQPPTPPSGGGGGGGGAPLPGGPSQLPSVFQPSPAVLGAATVNPIVARVLGAATCISKLDDPMGVVRPDGKLAKRLAGRILLKVQACGEAWYVNPLTLKRHKLPADQSLPDAIRSLALKATDEQLKSVQVGELGKRGSRVASSYAGRFLQAADGSLWYVNPADGRRYDVSTAEKALEAMRKLGLGISNLNIAKVRVAE